VETLVRDYSHFDQYVTRLSQDVYAQPPDAGHTAWGIDAVNTLCTIPRDIVNVLDVGCGQGFLAPAFENIGLVWTGVTIGEDFVACKAKGLSVYNEDMSFLPFEDSSYDLIFARHVLEHSPFPIITLMEWRRVCRGWLVLVAPGPVHWGWGGRNHYSVAAFPQLEWWLHRAGWNLIHNMEFTNRDPRYLEHWDAYQAIAKGDTGEVARQHRAAGIVTTNDLVEQTPKATVEYRLLCEMAEPITE